MSTFYCPRCKTEVAIPAEMVGIVRAAIVRQVRGREKMSAIRTVREYQPDLTQAKAVVDHVTRAGGVCIRCSHVFGEPGEHHCPKCKTLNLNW